MPSEQDYKFKIYELEIRKLEQEIIILSYEAILRGLKVDKTKLEK